MPDAGRELAEEREERDEEGLRLRCWGGVENAAVFEAVEPK